MVCGDYHDTSMTISSQAMLAARPWPPPATPIDRRSSTAFLAVSATASPSSQRPDPLPSAAGKIKRLVLNPESRTKLNSSPDREFYSYPRFVTHVDDGFVAALTELYRERLRSEHEVLDLMSSWVSHLPPEVKYRRVVGHGMNAQELARNPRLDYFFVKDLNREQTLELQSASFDAVLCTVSVQYLQEPEKVFAEVFRVLRPGGLFIVSFSNRLFYEKAISAWRDGTAYSRVQLVVQYFQCIEGFTQPEVIRKLQNRNRDSRDGNSPLSWIMNFLGLLSGLLTPKMQEYVNQEQSKRIFPRPSCGRSARSSVLGCSVPICLSIEILLESFAMVALKLVGVNYLKPNGP
ncbi:hypothetical protein SAY87_008624 [Trapa incisa]|uniref:Methyltransferase type 11 domain-containing protein n=1 Tax=Trapa incisa TaxID=236973 RepID=A0AAN7JXJ6_9MYRT|nr:hypothetical protein SAY87_008624 [Trapa incisa]